MKIEKLFDKIEKLYKKSIKKNKDNEEKKDKLRKIISKKIQKTKLNIKKSNNDFQLNKLKKKLKVLKKLSQKVDL